MPEQPVFTIERKSHPDAPVSYWIPRYVYVGATPEGGVIMDLRKDRYTGVTREQMRALSATVHDWPLLSFSTVQSDPIPGGDVTELIDEMLSSGLLTRNRAEANSMMSASFGSGPEATVDFSADDDGEHCIEFAHIFNFAISVISAVWMLHFQPLQRTVDRIVTRKRQAATSCVTFDTRKALQLATVFRRLQSYTYTGRGRCLLETLALLNFLARYGMFPLWVIGVSTGPFQAHSWVQHGHVVLGGTPEETYFSHSPIVIA